MAKLLRASATVGGGVSQVELDAFTGTTNIATLGTVGTGTWEGTTVAVDQGGTGVTSKTGTGNVVLSSSPTLVTPALGTPASGNASNLTSIPAGNLTGTIADARMPNLTGDVTTSEGAVATSISGLAMSKTALVGGTGLTLSTNTLNVDAAQTQITSVGTIATGTWEGTDVGVAHGGTGVSTLTDGGVLLGSGTGAITATAVLADGEMLVGDASGDPAIESGATLRTSIGLGNVDNTADASQTSVGTVTSGTWQGTTVAVNQGGTGATTHTANNVLIGAGTSAISSVAPSTSGNVLTSNGSVWASTAASSFDPDGAVVFNDTGADVDFRVEGSGDANALFVQGSDGYVGIGTGTPDKPLTIDRGATGISPLKLVSASKYCEIGALNASHVHFLTDVNHSFYYNSGVEITGALAKGSGSFKIRHPLPEKNETHNLMHSFVESPQADNIYRGQIDLIGGTATINIDTYVGMTDGTFVALNREIQCFTSNESGWTPIKGSVAGNIFTITAKDNTCTDTIHWLVIGERQDQHMYDRVDTDSEGKIILEPEITENDIQMRARQNA